MASLSTSSSGKAGASDSDKLSEGREGGSQKDDCCDIDINIENHGKINIYNCASPGKGNPPSDQGTPPDCQSSYPPVGACLPVVPGAKHKLSRDFKLAELAERVPVPSSLAAGAVHMARRYLLGKTATGPLETAAFATFSQIKRSLLDCAVSAFDAIPPRQRNRLFAPSLLLDPNQPLDEGKLTAALAQEILQRIGVEVFNDPQGGEMERPGKIRVYAPSGEDFFNQVRICSINGIRTTSYLPPLDVGNYQPNEIQQDCQPEVVNGQPEVVCQDQTTDCPGNTIGNVCARVLDVAQGDGVTLQGVNYFSLDTKVRFVDKQTWNVVRDVETHVFGDVDTPVSEDVNGQTVLINDCRVHDRLTFQVPEDLAPAVYQIQVVVPNITGIDALGTEIASNSEFISVIVPSTARFQVVSERIYARKETSPAWLGSDEVGLHTLAFPLFQDGSFGTAAPQLVEQKFTDIQNIDFDTGTARDITRVIFKHDQPILGLVLSVRGDEIDSQDAYDHEVTSSMQFFIDLIKDQSKTIGAAITALGGISALTKLGTIGLIIAGIAALVTVGIDIIVALWAPADPIIRDAIGLSIVDLSDLTSANAPAPAPSTHNSEDNIVVNVNKNIPARKLPFEYHETREYISSDQDSYYELSYRYNRLS